jgi:hypothetical protein
MTYYINMGSSFEDEVFTPTFFGGSDSFSHPKLSKPFTEIKFTLDYSLVV